MSDEQNKKNRLKEAMGLYSINFDVDDTIVQNDYTALLQENIYLRHFIPLLLSMTLNQPREYWENDYEQQLDTFDHSLEVIQTATVQESNEEHKTENTMEDLLDKLFVWFGPEVLMASIQFISQLPIDRSSSILDLGCGNGHFTELLYKLGYKNLTASDFSQNAIQLSKKVHLLCNPSEKTIEQSSIRYLTDDITKSHLEDESFYLVFDKGTLDSIAMVSNKFIQQNMLDPLYQDNDIQHEEDNNNDNNNEDNTNTPNESSLQNRSQPAQRDNTNSSTDNAKSSDLIIPNSLPQEESEKSQVDLYAENIYRILKPEGYLLIISCNHDVMELCEILEGKAKLKVVQDYTELFNDLRMMIFQKK